MLNYLFAFAILINFSGLYANNSLNLSTDTDITTDLEVMAQDFVLEVKQLQIPDHPYAFNPSLIRWHDKLLLSFDAYTEGTNEPDRIGLAFLDDDFNVIGAPQTLDLPRIRFQDARLTLVKDRLYLVFNGAISGGIRRTFVAEVAHDSGRFTLDTPEVLLHFPGVKADQWERNWIPFEYCNTLLLTTDLVPHRILQPLLGTHQCEEVSSTVFSSEWNWGTPKPGTAALLDGDRYLALFHSVKVIATTHSEGKPLQHYFMGAYTFENHPPFAITAISRNPIVGKNFYHGPEYTLIKPCRVVFPCGIVMDDRFVWVVFGRQDHELWMAKLDKKGLYESMVPVTSR